MLADRVKLINPQARPEPRAGLLLRRRPPTSSLALAPDFVVDAIDNVTAKCHLFAACKRRGLPVVSSMGASGRMDPDASRVVDLAETKIDPLADAVRRTLRQKYDFPPKGSFGIPAVFSRSRRPSRTSCTTTAATASAVSAPAARTTIHGCEDRRVIYGTAGFVTGAFQACCASVVIRALAG